MNVKTNGIYDTHAGSDGGNDYVTLEPVPITLIAQE